jgi:hypothetical protein
MTAEEREDYMYEQRRWLAEQYTNEKLVKLHDRQIVRFSWGREDSPIHSEPDLICDRIFMTILYGSESEL